MFIRTLHVHSNIILTQKLRLPHFIYTFKFEKGGRVLLKGSDT